MPKLADPAHRPTIALEQVLLAIRQISSSNFVIVGVDFPAVVAFLAEVGFQAAEAAVVASQDLVGGAADSLDLAAGSLAEAVKVAVVVVMVIEDQGRIRT